MSGIKDMIEKSIRRALNGHSGYVKKDEIALVLQKHLEGGQICGNPQLELVEESEDMQMVREIMEEPKEDIEYKLSMQVARPLEYIKVTVQISEDSED